MKNRCLFSKVHAEPGALLRNVIVSAGHAESQRDIKRIMRQGGVTVGGIAITEPEARLIGAPGHKLQVSIGGKRVLEIIMLGED